MSSEHLTQNTGRRSSSKASSRRSSQEPPHPAHIPLPPSPPEPVQEEQVTPEASTRPANGEKSKEKERKPTLNESWEKVLKEVARHDEDMVKGWRDDIDTLLVFAGLFSAVVTAFAIESYQWLDEDPADTTVALLTQLILVQVNGSQSIFEPTPFKPDASSIRINIFWFLSLIFSLTSALFGLLCKQWVREHQRDTTTRTPGEALALRQLRRDSFEKWGVSSFLSALPILLEVALLFFFAGVLDLLWSRHPVPFTVCFVAISLSAGLYFLTTVLPTLMVSRDQIVDIFYRRFDQLSYQFICPYKSPQAWLVYRLSSSLLRPLLKSRVINKFLRQKARRFRDHIKSPAPDWSSFDLWVVRQFDQDVRFPSFSLKVYELRAFEWAVTMFRDSPSMIPHLQNVLETIPASVAISAIFDRWDLTMWNTVSMEDVEYTFTDPFPKAPTPAIRAPILQQPEGISRLFYHQYWAKMAVDSPRSLVARLSDKMKYTGLQYSTGLRFVIPFSILDVLWTHEDPHVRAQSLQLLSLLEQSWQPCLGYDGSRHDEERVAFMRALVKHINHTDRVSELLTSKRGQAFIRFIHNEAIIRQYFRYSTIYYTWPQAISRVQEVGGLPSSHFAPIPENRWDPPPTLPTLDSVRYSIETDPGVQVGNEGVLDIVTLNGTGHALGVRPIKGGLVRRLGAWLASRSWLFLFQRDERVTHNEVGSSGNIAPGHESGMDGAGQIMDNQGNPVIGMGTLGDDDEDNDGDNYRLHSLNLTVRVIENALKQTQLWLLSHNNNPDGLDGVSMRTSIRETDANKFICP